MLPGLAAAHRWLSVLYAQPGGDARRAGLHSELYADLRKRRAGTLQTTE